MNTKKKWKLVKAATGVIFFDLTLIRNVYRGKQRKTKRAYALKRMKLEISSDGFPASALKEITTLSKLEHKNIIHYENVATAKYVRPPYYDRTSPIKSGPSTYQHNFFLVSEFMDHSLTGLLKYGMKFNLAQIKYLIREILEGVAYIHSKGIVHRDIKCSNILMNTSGEVKIADFGLATSLAPTAKKSHNAVTRWYRAPEMLQGKTNYGQEIDIWALGCCFAELLKGEALFQGKDETEQLNMIMGSLGKKSSEEEKCTILINGAESSVLSGLTKLLPT